MSDITAQLRRATEVAYGASYPPEVWGGGGSAADPHITSLDPESVWVGVTVTLYVTGTNFTATSVIEVDQVAQATVLDTGSGELTATFPAGGAAGTRMITVRNDNGEESNSVPLTVNPPTADTTGDDTTEVCAHGTVDEVKAYVSTHPERAAAALDAERAGRNRSTLVGWLEDFLVDVYPATGDEA
jgi:hypothetical protein